MLMGLATRLPKGVPRRSTCPDVSIGKELKRASKVFSSAKPYWRRLQGKDMMDEEIIMAMPPYKIRKKIGIDLGELLEVWCKMHNVLSVIDGFLMLTQQSCTPSFYFQVSSPGAERLLRVPQDLERFKDLPMQVSYLEEITEANPSSKEQDGIFQLDCLDLDSGYCMWKLANVKVNREASGKGRSLSRKRRDWRLRLPLSSLRLVRLYLEG
eukprot:Gb_22791 [translate_table: standard]